MDANIFWFYVNSFAFSDVLWNFAIEQKVNFFLNGFWQQQALEISLANLKNTNGLFNSMNIERHVIQFKNDKLK